MPESYFQLPPASTGEKLRYLQRTVGANDVHGGHVYQTAPVTFSVLAETTCANALKHLSIFNGSGSGQVVYIKKLFIIIRQEAGITGGRLRFELKRITTCSGGTDLTPIAHDSALPAILPAEVVIQTGATATEGALLFPLTFTNDEMLITQNSATQALMAGLNWMPEGIEVQDVVLREGEGITIKQLTNATGGNLAWYCVFGLEP